MRPSWDEYFMLAAKLAASRSTCLTFPVGAVIVKDRQILATGYNGPPSGMPHCNERGFCYQDLDACGLGSILPSRAIHAEANAISQAAKHGISTNGASIYVTLFPCLSCLKLIIASGIAELYYETDLSDENPVTKDFLRMGLLQRISQVQIHPEVSLKVGIALSSPTSVRV